MSNGSSMLREILQDTFTKYATKEGATVSTEMSKEFAKEVLTKLTIRMLASDKENLIKALAETQEAHK